MIRTLDFVLYAQKDTELKNKIVESMKSNTQTTLSTHDVILSFNPSEKTVNVDGTEEAQSQGKYIPCKMEYSTLEQLLKGNYSDLSGLEWGSMPTGSLYSL